MKKQTKKMPVNRALKENESQIPKLEKPQTAQEISDEITESLEILNESFNRTKSQIETLGEGIKTLHVIFKELEVIIREKDCTESDN